MAMRKIIGDIDIVRRHEAHGIRGLKIPDGGHDVVGRLLRLQVRDGDHDGDIVDDLAGQRDGGCFRNRF